MNDTDISRATGNRKGREACRAGQRGMGGRRQAVGNPAARPEGGDGEIKKLKGRSLKKRN